MGTFDSIIGLVLLGGASYLMYWQIKDRKDLFNMESLGKAFGTMGWVGLGLCGFVMMLYWTLPPAQHPTGKSVGTAPIEKTTSFNDRKI